MVEKAAQRCQEGTPIPSKSLVRLQFAPKNPFAKSAYNFTSRINVQYKIQRRQLRLAHADEHYCNALFRYLKEYAVEAKDKGLVMVCMDDKAKVPVGEPGFSVSNGVRGRMSIVPTTTTLSAGDHDMTKSSLTPSVTLQVNIPESSDESFVQGKVSVTVNESVFQSSNPFRHATSLAKILSGHDVKILLKYSDGGTDHRNTLESVKCSAICLFKELNLDMLTLARCAPGHSWRNPAERVMSVLNIGLQNCSLERQRCEDKVEDQLKKYGSMAQIRQHPELREPYTESVEPVQALIRNRFARLKLKDEPFSVLDPVSDLKIDVFKRHLRELFPTLDESKLTKVYTSKVDSYLQWITAHCRERHYSFQIKKCNDSSCCLPTTFAEELAWLPDPVLKDGGEHFMSYSDIKGTDTDESDRPTFKTVEKVVNARQTRKRKPTVEAAIEGVDDDETNTEIQQEDGSADASLYTAQNSRAVVNCVECRKPRVLYSKRKLSSRHNILIATAVSEFDYTCGAPLFERTDTKYSLLKTCSLRPGLSCANAVEVAYYSSSLGRPDICSYCALEDAEVDAVSELYCLYASLVLKLEKTPSNTDRMVEMIRNRFFFRYKK